MLHKREFQKYYHTYLNPNAIFFILGKRMYVRRLPKKKKVLKFPLAKHTESKRPKKGKEMPTCTAELQGSPQAIQHSLHQIVQSPMESSPSYGYTLLMFLSITAVFLDQDHSKSLGRWKKNQQICCNHLASPNSCILAQARSAWLGQKLSISTHYYLGGS